jgi:uncharacterized RDD family membrane protein YckC
MTGPGASQEQQADLDQERLWAAGDEAGMSGDLEAPGEAGAAIDDATASGSVVSAPPPGRPAGRRSARSVGAAAGWTQSLTSTAAVPGPSGLALADVPNRSIALVLDVLLLAAIGLLLALTVGGLFGGMTSGGATTGGPLDEPGRDLNLAAFLVVGVAQLAVSFGYLAYGWVMLRATLGMRLLTLRIGDERDGRPVSWNQALVRWLLLGLPATLATFAVYVPSLVGLVLSLIGLLWLLLLLWTMTQSPAKQGLQDRYARTIVVRAPRRPA